MYRKTYAVINEDYLKENVENIIKNYNDYKYYFAVVKANAYGHGSHIVNALIDGGINYLAVSSLEEAIDIRKYNKDIPVLCFGYIAPDYIDEAIKNNITITIVSYDYFKELVSFGIPKNLKVHLKLNTGMNRFGLNTKEEVKEVYNTLKDKGVNVEGIYTHYATSGVLDVYWDKQTKKFEELTSLIDLKEIPIVHLYSSLPLVKHDKNKYANGVRLGIAIYGYSSSAKNPIGIRKAVFDFKKLCKTHGKNISPVHISNELELKKALELYSEVVNINRVKAGDPVGYKAEYIADEDSYIATIPVGHADGITKYYKNVKINNNKYQIVALTMDYIMVKVDNTIKVHDKVMIIGDDISLLSIAKNSGISIHQALVSISNRVPRVHVYKGKETEIKY